MRTLAVIALKGGSGKTTIAAHLALAAHLRGVDTVVADLDRQKSITNVLGGREAPGPRVIPTTGPELMRVQFAAVGLKKDLLIIDTAAGAIEDVGEAAVLADLSVLVVRPTLLDISGLAPTLNIVRKLGKPTVVVLSQAPVARVGMEAPVVTRALRALDYMKAPLAPVVVRNRVIYQTALETGRSVEERSDAAAAAEIAALWTHVSEALHLAAEETAALDREHG